MTRGTWLVAGIALGLFPAIYALARWLLKCPSSGDLARHLLRAILVVMPLVLIGALLCSAQRSGFGENLNDLEGQTAGARVIAIYADSATRVLQALADLVPAVAIVFKVFGDILFYVSNSESPLSKTTQFKERLRALLDIEMTDPTVTHTVVVAHSQGSRIAYDVLAHLSSHVVWKPVVLITAGSPLQTLYEDFLGVPLAPLPARSVSRWINVFRDGDYIGGAIKLSGPADDSSQFESIPMGDGGHVRYWSDPALGRTVVRSL